MRKTIIARFKSLEMARRFKYEHAIKPVVIILGDDGFHWIVRLRDLDYMLRIGYETIK